MPAGLVDSYNDSDVITQRKTRLPAIKVWLQNSGRALKRHQSAPHVSSCDVMFVVQEQRARRPHHGGTLVQ